MTAGRQDRRLWAALLLLAATCAAYSPLWQAGFIWDDDDYVTENENLRSVEGLRRIWTEPGATHQYYPLVHTTFWIEHHLWGVDPLGYHAVNVLLHAMNAFLVGWILWRLKVPGAFLAAAIFALHPVHVESVAWVTERKNVLSGLFYLLALSAWLRFRPPGEDDSRHRGGWAAYAAVVVLFLLALLSKTVTASLPAVLVLVIWWKQPRFRWRELLPLVPLFALGLAFARLTVWMERTHVGAEGASWDLSLLERVLIAGRALWFYVGKLIWPHPLIFIYPRWTIVTDALRPWLFPATAGIVLLVLAVTCRRRGKGILTAALVFAGTLVPALGFIDVYPMRYSFVADHFQYLASAALIALFAAALATAAGDGVSAFAGKPGAAVSIAILLVLGCLTWQRTHAYRDVETLWRDTLTGNPSAWIAHTNLGNILGNRGDLTGAIDHYETALSYEPHHVEAHNNLGLARARQGQLEEARFHFEMALLIDPTFAASHNNLGLTLMRLGQPGSAAAQFEQALEHAPEFVDARFNQATAMVRAGDLAGAERRFREVLERRPADAVAHRELGQVLESQGRSREAITHYREALGLHEDWRAQNNLAWILATHPDPGTRRGAEAVSLAEQACRLTGFRRAGALDTLAAAQAEAGRYDAAVSTAQQAIDLAEAGGQPALAGRIRERQALYRERRPYRDEAAARPKAEE